MMWHTKLWRCAAALLVIAAPAGAQEPEKPKQTEQKVKVFQALSTDHLEALLKDMGIQYQKSFAFPLGTLDYRFMRNNVALRIHYSGGQDIWIDAHFLPIPIEEANRWNRQTRLSRAVLVSSGGVDSVSLDAQLACTGGVTEGMIRQFVSAFEKEARSFAAFRQKLFHEETEIKTVTAAHLEKLLGDFKVEFKTVAGEGKEVRFEFTKDQHKMLLTCQDNLLILRATYAKLPLEKVNKYNVDRRYTRAFLDKGPNGHEVTVLESTLDCRGGVTASILRSFLVRFSEELKYMDRFATF